MENHLSIIHHKYIHTYRNVDPSYFHLFCCLTRTHNNENPIIWIFGFSQNTEICPSWAVPFSQWCQSRVRMRHVLWGAPPLLQHHSQPASLSSSTCLAPVASSWPRNASVWDLTCREWATCHVQQSTCYIFIMLHELWLSMFSTGRSGSQQMYHGQVLKARTILWEFFDFYRQCWEPLLALGRPQALPSHPPGLCLSVESKCLLGEQLFVSGKLLPRPPGWSRVSLTWPRGGYIQTGTIQLPPPNPTPTITYKTHKNGLEEVRKYCPRAAATGVGSATY